MEELAQELIDEELTDGDESDVEDGFEAEDEARNEAGCVLLRCRIEKYVQSSLVVDAGDSVLMVPSIASYTSETTERSCALGGEVLVNGHAILFGGRSVLREGLAVLRW
jgi:hypothetical protein